MTTTDRRPYPILNARTAIPWGVIAGHEAQAYRNHGQTLKGLAGRGGLGWSEALAVLEDREWRSDQAAKAKVLAIVERWESRQADRIEAAAVVLWHRFAPDGRLQWEDETHKAEFRLAAQSALEAAANVG